MRSREAGVPRIVIAAGGTAGHVVPALAVAEALRERGAQVDFVGGERAEAELVPRSGFGFHPLRVAGIDRRNPLRAARAVTLAAAATARARRLLRRLGADAVVGGGGYVAGPVGLAARTLGLPLALSEVDSQLGFANRLLAPFARRVFLSFPIPERRGGRYVVTGRPLRMPADGVDRERARERFGIPSGETCLLVFGGSLGARRLNEAAVEAFGADAPCAVLHACGRRDHDELRRRLDELGAPSHNPPSPSSGPSPARPPAADLAAPRAAGPAADPP